MVFLFEIFKLSFNNSLFFLLNFRWPIFELKEIFWLKQMEPG